MAFAIDLGVTVHHRASLQNAADAAALAAADVLERGRTWVNNNEVRSTARQYFQLNRPGVMPNIQLGHWDPITRVFDPGIVSQLEVNAVSVSAQWTYPSLFAGFWAIRVIEAKRHRSRLADAMSRVRETSCC